MEVTQKMLAECLGISPRQVRNLKTAGLFRLPAGEKKYNLEKCIQEYIQYKVNDETGRHTIVDKERVAAEHEEVKRKISLLKLRKLRRELHEAADVESYLTNMLLAFRNRLEALPQKAAMQIAGVTDMNEVIEILAKIVSEALNELAGYDPDEIDGQKAGALYDVLKEFADRGVNMTRIESRPARTELGAYIFFFDLDVADNEEALRTSVEAVARKSKWLKDLGSFPVVRATP